MARLQIDNVDAVFNRVQKGVRDLITGDANVSFSGVVDGAYKAKLVTARELAAVAGIQPQDARRLSKRGVEPKPKVRRAVLDHLSATLNLD